MSYHNFNAAQAHYVRAPMGSVPQLIAPVLGNYAGAGGLGDDAAKESLKAARVVAFRTKSAISVNNARNKAKGLFRPTSGTVVLSNGKVVVPTASFFTQWNKAAAQVMTPFRGVIDVMPMSSALKTSMKNTPFDVLLDIFDPVEVKIGRAVDRVLAKKGNVQNYFGTNKNLKRVQALDLKADTSTQNLMRRLRTMDAFFVLFFTQPIELGVELFKEGINLAGEVGNVIAKVAQDAAKAAGQAAGAATQAAGNAAAEVAAWFGLSGSGLGGYEGIGLPIIPEGAVAGSTAVAPAAEVAIGEIVATITGIIVDTIAKAVALNVAVETATGVNLLKMATGQDVKEEGFGFNLQPGVLRTIGPMSFRPGAAAGAAGSGFVPAKISPSIGPTVGPSVGPAQSNAPPPPPVVASSGGIPPIAIFGGAALVAVFLLSRK